MYASSARMINNLQCDAKRRLIISQVDIVEEDPTKDEEADARICRTPGDAGCTFVFKYQYHRAGTGGDIKIFKIQAEQERACPTPINVFGNYFCYIII